MRKIYIVGAGGFGKEVAWLIERINSVIPVWELAGFIDDDEEKQSKQETKYPVIGDCSLLARCEEEVWVVCAIGAAEVRKKVIRKIEGYRNVKFATLIDPSVTLSSAIRIGEGSIICAGTILTVDISIGCHVIINLDCTVGHDAMIGDFVTIYPSVNVSGCVTVEECVELGTGTQIIQGRKIGCGTVVGAGAVVTKDLPSGCTAVGMPAKPVKYRQM
ncbi:MAG: acetyltransferase [Lachnospiraceae bacterium]|nr:acetyltransferase [Lachnospiraceae bacterium]MCM1237870.1 acetyltransferase [Lachnospiraceae bacterium]